MLCGTTANDRIHQLNKRALRVLHGDYTSTFEELLVRSEEIIIHCNNLQKLMIEIYKCINTSSLAVLSKSFTTKEMNYNLSPTVQELVPTYMTSLLEKCISK